jgi:hypothetical protein
MRGRFERAAFALILLLISLPASAMPQALVFAGTWLLSYGTALSAAGWIVGIGLVVSGSVWGGAKQRQAARDAENAARAAFNAALKDRMTTVITSDAPLLYAYGETVVGTRIVDVSTSGDRDQYHHLVCVHADHECEAILDVSINDKWLGALDASGFVTQGDFLETKTTDATEYQTGLTFTLAHTPISGSLRIVYWDGSLDNGSQHNMPYTIVGNQVTVTESHDFTCSYQWTEPLPRVRVKKRLGVAGTPADADTLAECPTEYLSTSTLEGKCATIIRLDLAHAELQNGAPNIKVKLRGKKLHDVRDPDFPLDTPVWSQNPALAIHDYLTSEICGVPGDTVALTGTAQAATLTSLTLPAGASVVDDYYKDMVVRVTGGAGSVQERKVLSSRRNKHTSSENTAYAALEVVGDVFTRDTGVGMSGGMTADRFIIGTTSSGNHRFRPSPSSSQTAGNKYARTWYLRPVGVDIVSFLEWSSTSSTNGGKVSLTGAGSFITDPFGSGANAPTVLDWGIELLDNGIYKVWFSWLCNYTASHQPMLYAYDSLGNQTWAGDGVVGVEICGLQLEDGDVATEYVRTEATAAVGVAVDAPWAVNRFTYSDEFDNAAWIKARASITPNATTASDGTLTADLLIEDTTAANSHMVYRVVTPAIGDVLGWSVEAKLYSGNRHLAMYFSAGAWGSFRYASFDLATGAVTFANGSIVASTEYLGDGWWRCIAIPPASTVSAATNVQARLNNGATTIYTGDGVSGIYLRRAQYFGAYLTPSIETGATAILPPDATSTFHLRSTESEIPYADYIAAANVCDEVVPGLGARYTINGTVTSEQSRPQVLDEMARCMAGTITPTTWGINAGAWAAPVMALSQDDIVGDFSWSQGSSRADLFNGVKGQYVSAENDHVPTDFKPYQNTAYVTADGEELWTNVDFSFTDEVQRVHNICRIMVEDQRNGFAIEGDFSFKTWGLSYGDRVTFTSALLGQSAKVYRVVGKTFGMNQAVQLKLKEDDATIWDFADAVLPDSTPNTNLPNPYAIAPIETLTLSSGTPALLRQADGTVSSRILVQWPLATSQGVLHGGAVEVEFKPVGEEVWQQVQTTGDATQVYLAPVKDGLFYNVRARTINPYLNIKSPWFYSTHQVIGKTEAPSNVPVIVAAPTATGVTLTWEEIADGDRADYLIADDTGGALVWNVYSGATADLLPAIAGLHTYRIKARDTSKLVSMVEATCQLTINAPAAPVPTSAVQDGMALLSWNDCTTTHQILNYEVRHGASWDAGTFVGRADARSLRITPDWTGSRTFWIAGIDIAGNTGTAASLDVAVAAPSAPLLTLSVEGDMAVMTWTAPSASLPVASYEVRSGASWAAGEVIGRFNATRHELKVNWVGSRTFWVAAIDIAGNTGTADDAALTVSAAPAPAITLEVIDNNVLLRWGQVAGTLPTTSYELRKGASWAAGEVIGTKAGGFTSVFETAGGSYTYWLAAIDTAGNYGAAGSLTATVAQPPDYVLRTDYDSTFSGTKSNMSAHGDGSWIAPVNTTETFASHFTARGWTTPQAQIDAGYPVYAQPNASPAYYEETLDYGTLLASSRIAITLTSLDLVGAVAKTCKISISTDNATWTDYNDVWEVYALNFRYVKVRVTFTASNSTDLIEIEGLNIRLDSKQKTATKMVSCNAADSGGTTVYLTDDWTSTGNKLFLDVDAVSLTPAGTTPVTAVYDFADAPNPLSLKILLFDAAGARFTGTCSMTVRGY